MYQTLNTCFVKKHPRPISKHMATFFFNQMLAFHKLKKIGKIHPAMKYPATKNPASHTGNTVLVPIWWISTEHKRRTLVHPSATDFWNRIPERMASSVNSSPCLFLLVKDLWNLSSNQCYLEWTEALASTEKALRVQFVEELWRCASSSLSD